MSVIRSSFRSNSGESRSISTIDDYISTVNSFTFNGIEYNGGVTQTLVGGSVERVSTDFVGAVNDAYKSNGIVFACMLARRLVFSGIRFQYQRLNNGSPSTTFGSTSLEILERPWVGGTTQDLLNRVIDDADLAGNAYLTVVDGEIVRLRPDWVDIVVAPRMADRGFDAATGRPYKPGQLGWKKMGYIYTEGGSTGDTVGVPLLVGDVAHFAPVPDPLSNFRGMSWLTPVVREVQADKLMTKHKAKFFYNGATPNMVVKHPPGANPAAVKRFAEMMEDEHTGVENAYKNLHLYPGADLTVVGSTFEQIDFKVVQGAGETRIAAAGGVPPIIVGLSEGLSSATYSNYGQARRRFADGTMHPLWQNASGSMEILVPSQGPGTRLWYDAKGVPFLREDEKDAADIAAVQAQTIRTLVDGGYTPESALAAVQANDWSLLQHTGMYSVQLQPPGSVQPAPSPPQGVTP